ncbi:MAG TPA: hypothetical protein VLQ79_06090 [Myxococcaceae bacterium]|nr:hypothetical protein [Myxococcaceae bacterium]
MALAFVLTACTNTSGPEGCGACGVVPPALTLRVLDAADAGIVHSARVNGFPFDCPTFCQVQLPDGGSVHRAGPVPVAVDAPGYVPQQLEVTVPAVTVDPRACCGLDFVPQQWTVLLVPL